MNLFFRISLYTMAALTVGIILSFVYFEYLRRHMRKQNMIMDAYIQKNHHSWYQYLLNRIPFDENLLWQNVSERKAIEALLLSYSRNVKDPIVRTQISKFADTYLTADYEKILKNRRWSVRINTLHRIASFRMTTLNGEIQSMMNRPRSTEVGFNLLQIYLYVLPNEFFDQLLRYQDQLSEYQFKQLFLDISVQVKQTIIAGFNQLNKVGQYAFIDIQGKKQTFEDHYSLMALLDSDDSEIRIRALKAMSAGTIISDKERILSFIDSDIWQERLMVAKIFAKRPARENEGVYRALIKDPVWWVRNEAARVLSLSHNGREVLRDIMANSDDKFAVDVSRAFLLKTKGGIA